MKSNIIGYKAPYSLFGGSIPQGTIYKPLSSKNNQTYTATKDNGSVYDGGLTDLPKEIVETWKAVYGTEYKVGDYVTSIEDCGDLRRVGQVFKVLSLDLYGGIYYMENVHGKPSGFRPSTSTEIDEYNAKELLEEAKRRYPVGTRFIGAHVPNQTASVSIVTNDTFKISRRQSKGVSIYAMTDDGTYYINSDDRKHGNTSNGRIVWFEGRWAEILTYPCIFVNGYAAIFFDDYVKFGCAKISKQLFLELYAVKDSTWTNGREIESVTIGKGTFTKAQIKEIAEHYLSK
jgi:hypothetical protein